MTLQDLKTIADYYNDRIKNYYEKNKHKDLINDIEWIEMTLKYNFFKKKFETEVEQIYQKEKLG